MFLSTLNMWMPLVSGIYNINLITGKDNLRGSITQEQVKLRNKQEKKNNQRQLSIGQNIAES